MDRSNVDLKDKWRQLMRKEAKEKGGEGADEEEDEEEEEEEQDEFDDGDAAPKAKRGKMKVSRGKEATGVKKERAEEKVSSLYNPLYKIVMS